MRQRLGATERKDAERLRHKRRRERLRAEGKCGRCGRDSGGKAYCSTCAELRGAGKRVTREGRKLTGYCMDCGLFAASDGYSTCLNCRESDTKRRAEIVAQRREAALCVCGQSLLPQGAICETCWFRLKAQKVGFGRRNWKLLRDLLIAQGCRCAYTGIKLEVGSPMATIDHKLPRSRGGEHVIENFHWITKRMNEMKGTFTHEEFIEVCQIVSDLWPNKQNQLHIA